MRYLQTIDVAKDTYEMGMRWGYIYWYYDGITASEHCPHFHYLLWAKGLSVYIPAGVYELK